MNPGPAISIFSKNVPSSTASSQISSAIFLGASLNDLAETIAAFAAKSPWVLSAGISTMKSGIGSAGSFFRETSLPSESSIISLACDEASLIKSDICKINLPMLF